MELLLTSDLASDLTKQLHTAMDSQDLEACRDLLQRRERAMEDFERAHRNASNQERESCRANMVALARADENLQERSQDILTMITAEFREQLGLPTKGIRPTAGAPHQACLDRKA